MPIFVRALRDRRVSLAWWAFGVVVYTGFIVAVWPVIDGNDEFQDLYDDMPEAMQAMFGSDGFSDFTSPAGFLNTYLFSLFLPFIITGLTVSLGSALLAGEEEQGLLDLVLSHPIERRRVVLEKFLAIAVSTCVMGALVVVSLTVLREPVDLDIGFAGLVAATIGSVLFALVHGLVALAAGAWRGQKGFATGLAWAVALVGYLVNLLANLDDSLEWLAPFSPLHWATTGSPVEGSIPATYLALVGASVVLLVATLELFERHDLS